ncbi:MAG: hypothetical protein CML68_12850 [Rhodobacteraceae bacterium]|nr:hypothetical protein [Paracoccaceae bacterium]
MPLRSLLPDDIGGGLTKVKCQELVHLIRDIGQKRSCTTRMWPPLTWAPIQGNLRPSMADPVRAMAPLINGFRAVVIGSPGDLWRARSGDVILGVAQPLGAQISTAFQRLAGHIVVFAIIAIKTRGHFRDWVKPCPFPLRATRCPVLIAALIAAIPSLGAGMSLPLNAVRAIADSRDGREALVSRLLLGFGLAVVICRR